MAEVPAFRRALYLSTGTSVLVPVVGLITAPVMAKALGVDGRGEVAAAMAPNSVIVIIAMIGLPEALTVVVARNPLLLKRALAVSGVVSIASGLLCLSIVAVFATKLSGGDVELSSLVVLGTSLAVPALLVNILRGAAIGLQMWTLVAAERVINSVLRLIIICVLAGVGQLTALTAVLALSLTSVVAGIVYLRVLKVDKTRSNQSWRGTVTALLSFGPGSWIGSVASMVNGRLAQLVITPLSNVGELGLFVVAIMISDVPLIVAAAVRDVVFGASARERDVPKLGATLRLAVVASLLVACFIAAVLPLALVPLFGEGFAAALVPTWLLLAAGVVGIPGLITGSALGAWGRPMMGSVVSVSAFTVNLVGLAVLVPVWGAIGAATAGVVGSCSASVVGVVSMSRVANTRAIDLLVIRRSDLVVIARECSRFTRRRSRAAAVDADVSGR